MKSKVFKVVLAVVVILLILFLVHVIRNYVLLGSILKKQDELAKSTNYSYLQDSTNSLSHKFYYKDGTSTMAFNQISFWQDEGLNRQIYIDENNNLAIVSYYEYKLTVPVFEVENKLTCALFSSISSDVIYGLPCYVVDNSQSKTYICKENGAILKKIDKTETEFYGTEYTTTVWQDWTFNELSDEDVKMPDLTGYDFYQGTKEGETSSESNKISESEFMQYLYENNNKDFFYKYISQTIE